MTSPNDTRLQGWVDAMLANYRADPRAQHVNRRYLPSRDESIATVQLLLQLLYPGYFGRQDLTDENLPYHVGVLLTSVRDKLLRQVQLCLCYETEAREGAVDANVCEGRARAIVETFLDYLPTLRSQVVDDVQAAYDGDPAASNLDEVVLAYPGLLAITVYRIAHTLHEHGVPLMPRILTEWAHTQTGADIHPGAAIGKGFFIDHATGVVVGETTRIGDGVKLYQGVTLGALSISRDARGRVIRGTQRHPTVQDNVTVYANAIVLGGHTVLGRGSVVGGSVFLTRSVPEGARVALKAPDLNVNTPDGAAVAPEPDPSDGI